MLSSDESLRLGTAENRDSGHASRTAAPTHALDISGVPAAHSDARARTPRPSPRAPSSDLRALRSRTRSGRPRRARSSPRAPPRPLARSPRVATRWHPRCQRARSGRRHVRPDLALGSPRPSARARDPRARPGSPPPPPSRWRRPSPPRTRRSRRSRSRPPRAPPPPRGRPGAVVFASRAASPTTARRARMPFARGAQDHRDPAAALSPRSSPPPAPRSAPPR